MKDFYLEKINSNMSKKEFEMFQDIPAKENGSTGNTFNVNIYAQQLDNSEIDRIVDHIQYEFGKAF